MKFRSGVAFVLMICLVCAGLVIGAYKGWSGERAQVEQLQSSLDAMLGTRVESAYNLLTVARRHLPADDALLSAVAADRDTLEGSAGLADKAAANARLTADGKALLAALAALDSVQQDDRDRMYVESYLTQMLEESEEKTAGANYNLAAAQFNSSLRGSLSGRLAMALGVRTAQEFAAN